jgi:hypothetical protein
MQAEKEIQKRVADKDYGTIPTVAEREGYRRNEGMIIPPST